jgi:hypothetical protein
VERILAFWLPAVIFGSWFFVMAAALRTAIADQAVTDPTGA